jgi:putative ABC transport system substrate-binding protein
MRRRDFLSVLGSATIACPISLVQAQQLRTARVGILLFSTPEDDPSLSSLRSALAELGYVDGRNINFLYRGADGEPARLPGLAAELGGDVAPAAKESSAIIPIAASTSGDPVRGGLVASLRRPGGNLTGVTLLATDLAGKRVELISEAVPAARRIGFLWNPDHADDDLRETQSAAASLQLDILRLPVQRLSDLDTRFQAAKTAPVDALVVVSSRLTALASQRIIDFAMEHHLPLMCGWGSWVKRGGLMAYGPNLDESARRLAGQVDKLLKGFRASDLPIEQPTRFELGLNLRTARRFGLTISPSLLARANEVIE